MQIEELINKWSVDLEEQLITLINLINYLITLINYPNYPNYPADRGTDKQVECRSGGAGADVHEAS